MTDYNAKNGDIVFIDPDDVRGAWTINFPLGPKNNARVTIRPTTHSNTLVVLASLETIEYPIGTTPSTSVAVMLGGGSLSFVYNTNRGVWASAGTSGEQYMPRRNLITYYPLKSAVVEFSGDLSIAHDYNVVGVTNPSTGIYHVQISQTTVEGFDVFTRVIPSVMVYAPAAAEGALAQFDGGTGGDTFIIHVREFYLAGVNLRIQDYNLAPTETCWFMALANTVNPDADPLPP